MAGLLCEVCQARMAWSGEEGETLVGFWSPPGHVHDDNCLSRLYRCPNGHRARVFLRRRCIVPGCDWVGKRTCRCHQGEKVETWP